MSGTGIRQLRCDRRDEGALERLQTESHYDAVVDFCAYEPGDIQKICYHLPAAFDQYIYISTPDVTQPSAGVRDENSPVMTVRPEDEVGLYTWKKLELETELKEAVRGKGTGWTLLRPAFICGPFNYAPRESWYVENIIKNGSVLHPTNASGKFNMVYVKDLAMAILTCVYDGRSKDQIYTISGPEVLDYDRFAEAMKGAADRDFELVPVTVEDVLAKNLPLPFPLTEEENELFDGTKITRELGFTYTDFKENLKKAYDAFAPLVQRA